MGRILLGLLGTTMMASQVAHAAQVRWPMRFEVDAVPGIASVTAAATTPDGFVWLGSPRGLCRWDGKTLRCSDSDDAIWKIFATRGVNALTATAEGTLWIGTDEGLWSRNADGHLLAHKHCPSAPAAFDKIVALRAAKQNLWVASKEGLHLRSGGAWRHLPWPEANFAARIDDVKVDTSGSARFLLAGKLWVAQANAPSLTQQPLPLVPSDLRTARAHAPRASFVGDLVANWPQGAPDVFGALTDRDGGTWISTYDGVFTRDLDQSTPPVLVAGLPSTAFVDLQQDILGNVWTIGFGAGLFRISSPRRTSILGNDGRGGDAAFAIVQAGDGTIYVSTEHGLSVYDKGEHRLISPKMGLPSYTIRSLAVDGHDQVWMTTIADGLIQFDGNHFTRHSSANGLPSDTWRAIDAAGDSVWAAAADGSVITMNAVSGQWQRVQGVNSTCIVDRPCDGSVRAITATRRGSRVWFCTEGRGLLRWDKTNLKVFGSAEGLADAKVNYIKEDERGVAWAATDKGLFRIDERHAVRYGAAAGLPEQPLLQIVHAALSDGSHELWLGTRAGVLRISREQLEAVTDGLRKAVDVRRYSVTDGLVADETIGGFHPGGMFAQNGLVWFSTVRGLNLFDPNLVAPQPPTVNIQNVVSNGHVFGAQPWHSRRLDLPAGTRELEISYVAPVYGDPQRVQYSYRLAGLDETWTSVGARQTAYYTQLGPGQYQFQVQAHADGSRGHPPTNTLSLRIAPHYYQTGVFRGAAVMTALAMVLSAVRLRTRRVAARFKALTDERSRIARDFHDTLGQIFAASGLELDSLERAAPADKGLVDRIRHVRQTLAHGRLAARRALWNVRRAGDLEVARRPFTKTLRELGALYEDVSFVVMSTGDERQLPAEAEDQILRIAEEAVSNAIAHGHAQRVTIELQYREGGFSLWVRDDGAGFDPLGGKCTEVPGADTSGLGLMGMRERARAIGAELQVHSEPGVGSEIGVVFELKKRRRP